MAKTRSDKQQVKELFAAVEAGNLAKVRRLLAAGLNPEVKNLNYFRETPLLAAARSGQEAVFFELVKAGGNLHAVDELNRSVLWEAAGHGTLRMVEAVLATGLRPSDDLPFAFRLTCYEDDSLDMVKELLRAGADVNHKSEEGETPLICAVQGNAPKVVAELLRAGAKPDVRVPRDELGDNKHYKKTALELAEAEGYTKIAWLLRAAGAKPSATLAAKPKRPAGPTTVAESWKRIGRWLKESATGWKPLRKAAGAEQIARAEKRLGCALPADLRKSYETHDGSGDGQIFPWPEDISYSLLSLAQLVDDWQMHRELLDLGEWQDSKGKSDRGIRSDWWNPRWIPFAANGAGDFFCIDLSPAKSGKEGQVITHNHEDGSHTLLAPSFRAWLSKLADDLEAGLFSYDGDEGLV
jgi:cell wall assembly regulator SMI1